MDDLGTIRRADARDVLGNEAEKYDALVHIVLEIVPQRDGRHIDTAGQVAAAPPPRAPWREPLRMNSYTASISD